MLQETVIRTNHLQAPIIVCNKDAIIAIFPADHVIENQAAIEQSLAEAAKQDKLATFGIVADKPETGYGYIKANNHSVGCTSVQQNEQENESPDVGCTSVQQNENELSEHANRHPELVSETQPDNDTPVGCTSVQQNENELSEHANRHPELVSETQPDNDTPVGCTSVQQNENELSEHATRHLELVSETQPDNDTPVGCTSVQQSEQENKSPLELIEVQSGSYLGEDDIVRFEDIYKRCDNK